MGQESTEYKKKCKYLIERRIFKPGLFPCIISKFFGDLTYKNIERVHIIRQSQSTKYNCQILNILPISKKYHDAWLHAYNEDEAKFFAWLKDALPLHFAWHEQHLNERTQTIPLSYWEGLYKELKFYADHPAEAYRVIFENI